MFQDNPRRPNLSNKARKGEEEAAAVPVDAFPQEICVANVLAWPTAGP